jgi:hypothetical protein
MDARDYYPKREPGRIYHPARARQLNSFTGLKFGTITPTDLDGLIDYHNERFAFLELKLRDAPVSDAQATAIIRVVDAIVAGKKRAAFFVAEHCEDDPTVDVPADRCLIRCVYIHQMWHQPPTELTLRAGLDCFLGFGPPLELTDLFATTARLSITRAPSVDEIFRSSGGFK